MRNWNIELRQKELERELVCIVPMRNWNFFSMRRNDKATWRFVSYLWGIETTSIVFVVVSLFPRLYRTYEELKPRSLQAILAKTLFVCIVPMRNWNFAFTFSIASSFNGFVSYLWGIETLSSRNKETISFIQRLYRTYEELKHLCNQQWMDFLHRSLYRTYEELKL